MREPLGDVRRVARQYAAGRGMALVFSPARLVRLQQVVRAARLNRGLGDVRCGARRSDAVRRGGPVVDISPPVNRAEWWVGRGP